MSIIVAQRTTEDGSLDPPVEDGGVHAGGAAIGTAHDADDGDLVGQSGLPVSL
jgi:hypothetical protein